MFVGWSGVFRVAECAGFFDPHLLGVHYLIALLVQFGGWFIVKSFDYDKIVFARKPRVDTP